MSIAKFDIKQKVQVKYKKKELLIVTGLIIRDFGYQYLCRGERGYEYIYYGSELEPYTGIKKVKPEKIKIKHLLKMTNKELYNYLLSRKGGEIDAIVKKLEDREMFEVLIVINKMLTSIKQLENG